MDDGWRGMRQEMGTSRIVDDNNGCNEMEDTVPVSLYSLPDHALPTRPNELTCKASERPLRPKKKRKKNRRLCYKYTTGSIER
jgi:hypothetical protein